MRQLPRRLAPLAVLCTGLGFVAVAVAPAASADTVTQYFAATGAEQTFTVPSGVTSVHVVAVGARGGNDPGRGFNPAAAGGSGATVTADLDVSGVHLLYVEVGGNGQDTQAGTSAAGGFNGGGVGQYGGAGGGGGASDVRTGARNVSGSLGTRLLVAGGGGATAGGAGGASALNGSAGGNGTDSPDTLCQAGYGGNGGGGGGQSAGGSAGDNPQFGSTGAQDGAAGVGGNGGTSDSSDPGGGGGGGGLYGGGGGAAGLDCGGGGGGGSSYADPALAPDATYGTDATGTPSITITYVVPQAPQAVTEPASAIGFGSVTLNGVINPEGYATTYHFDIRNAGTTAWTTVTSELPAGTGSTQVAEQYVYSGVVPGTAYEYRLVATDSIGSTDGGTQSFTTLGGPPDATTEPATAIGQTGATLNGVVNPEGEQTQYWFDYGTSTSYGSQTPASAPVGGASQVPADAPVSGLLPGTTYHFALVAQNLSGTTTSTVDRTFTTSPASPAPSVTTKAATNIGQHGATLNGSVNPHGAATTYHFEYGTTTAYGHSTASVSAGSGTLAKAVHALLSGLPRHTTFHFRLVAVSANGTTDGLDKTFRTL